MALPSKSSAGTEWHVDFHAFHCAVRVGERQAQLGNGGFVVRKTIAKAFGLDAATRPWDFAFALCRSVPILDV
jgi:hypothetical protein